LTAILAIVCSQSPADSSRAGIVEHVQCVQLPIHLTEFINLSGNSWLHSSMKLGSRN